MISVDARNHGESPHTDNHSTELMASDVAHLMKNLNIKKASVMGHSMGGRAMMYFALRYVCIFDLSFKHQRAPRMNLIFIIYMSAATHGGKINCDRHFSC